jgi:membrane protein implicated in regulation of membrane protease activity
MSWLSTGFVLISMTLVLSAFALFKNKTSALPHCIAALAITAAQGALMAYLVPQVWVFGLNVVVLGATAGVLYLLQKVESKTPQLPPSWLGQAATVVELTSTIDANCMRVAYSGAEWDAVLVAPTSRELRPGSVLTIVGMNGICLSCKG